MAIRIPEMMWFSVILGCKVYFWKRIAPQAFPSVTTPVCGLVRNDIPISGSLLQNVLQTHLQDGFHVVVRQGIEDVFSIAAELDELHLLEDAQLVGNGTLA